MVRSIHLFDCCKPCWQHYYCSCESPQRNIFGKCINCGLPMRKQTEPPGFTGLAVKQNTVPKPEPAQPGEAIRELAKAISQAHFSGMEIAGFEGILIEHLAPLMEKAQIVSGWIGDGTIDCHQAHEQLIAELARWAEGEKK